VIKKLEEEKAIISYYGLCIPKFTNNWKEHKSLKELTLEEIKEKYILIITTSHSAIDYEIVVKNAKAIFDTRTAIKDNSKNVERL